MQIELIFSKKVFGATNVLQLFLSSHRPANHALNWYHVVDTPGCWGIYQTINLIRSARCSCHHDRRRRRRHRRDDSAYRGLSPQWRLAQWDQACLLKLSPHMRQHFRLHGSFHWCIWSAANWKTIAPCKFHVACKLIMKSLPWTARGETSGGLSSLVKADADLSIAKHQDQFRFKC